MNKCGFHKISEFYHMSTGFPKKGQNSCKDLVFMCFDLFCKKYIYKNTFLIFFSIGNNQIDRNNIDLGLKALTMAKH